jgi:hypothetical protein
VGSVVGGDVTLGSVVPVDNAGGFIMLAVIVGVGSVVGIMLAVIVAVVPGLVVEAMLMVGAAGSDALALVVAEPVLTVFVISEPTVPVSPPHPLTTMLASRLPSRQGKARIERAELAAGVFVMSVVVAGIVTFTDLS